MKVIKINEKNYETLQEIKELQGLKSMSEVMESILPDGAVTSHDFVSEKPAFVIKNHVVSWNNLRQSNVNDNWESHDGVESAVVIFKDDYGALVRFCLSNDVFVEYYHFL